ncbi:porin [Candidatus Venteria ishoeyi]|uniref:porin n=1 Tax=Candidatus Venteria ishoeyi TaxID=1899563 RepID=UPI0025A5B6AB|nr:porin [Candidatus Venteria ishoeyi]MDM8548023.1 porin [Candidatus Venteria ishoeyi]
MDLETNYFNHFWRLVMNKNLLSLAIIAAMSAPLAAQAEIKLSGTLQAEVGSLEVGNGDRQTVTSNTIGGHGSPNKMRFDVSHKLGGGLTAIARMDWSFGAFGNSGGASNFTNREKYVGLKASMAYFKMGRLQGLYKTSTLGYDKWAGTGLQARHGGGGMSGGAYGHTGFINNALEAGFKASGFKGGLQYVAGENDGNEGSYLGALQYGNKAWEVTASAAHLNNDANNTDGTNWKLAGKAKFGKMYMALHYESVELGDHNMGIAAKSDGVDSTDYLMGQIGYSIGRIDLNAWVAGIKAGDNAGSDATSYSLGAKYNFSKKANVYAGWHKADSDNDAIDNEAFIAGMRVGF